MFTFKGIPSAVDYFFLDEHTEVCPHLFRVTGSRSTFRCIAVRIKWDGMFRREIKTNSGLTPRSQFSR